MTYLIFKALHIIAMVAWFAAIFYLPRIFVYHAMAQADGEKESVARFEVMEKKLYVLGHIAMGLLLIFGVGLLVVGGWAAFGKQGWLHAKLLLVAILMGYYIYCGRIMKRFKAGENTKTDKFYRWFNEIPTVILILTVILATLKPF